MMAIKSSFQVWQVWMALIEEEKLCLEKRSGLPISIMLHGYNRLPRVDNFWSIMFFFISYNLTY